MELYHFVPRNNGRKACASRDQSLRRGDEPLSLGNGPRFIESVLDHEKGANTNCGPDPTSAERGRPVLGAPVERETQDRTATLLTAYSAAPAQNRFRDNGLHKPPFHQEQTRGPTPPQSASSGNRCR